MKKLCLMFFCFFSVLKIKSSVFEYLDAIEAEKYEKYKAIDLTAVSSIEKEVVVSFIKEYEATHPEVIQKEQNEMNREENTIIEDHDRITQESKEEKLGSIVDENVLYEEQLASHGEEDGEAVSSEMSSATSSADEKVDVKGESELPSADVVVDAVDVQDKVEGASTEVSAVSGSDSSSGSSGAIQKIVAGALIGGAVKMGIDHGGKGVYNRVKNTYKEYQANKAADRANFQKYGDVDQYRKKTISEKLREPLSITKKERAKQSLEISKPTNVEAKKGITISEKTATKAELDAIKKSITQRADVEGDRMRALNKEAAKKSKKTVVKRTAR